MFRLFLNSFRRFSKFCLHLNTGGQNDKRREAVPANYNGNPVPAFPEKAKAKTVPKPAKAQGKGKLH